MKNSLYINLIVFCFLIIPFKLNAGTDTSEIKSFVETSENIFVLTVKTPIVPILTDYLKEGISAALKDNAQCVIIRIDTPGGLLETMRDIVQLFLNSNIPIITYIYPNGAHAASAGVFIVYASDIAVMSSATNIGSASPVEMNGKDIGDSMKSKVSNDLIAFLESVAKEKNRNDSVVRDFIDKAVSFDAKTAQSLRIIDYISDDISDLLNKIDGKIIVKNKLRFKLNTQKYKVIEYNISSLKKILFYISNPNILYILMTIGIWALIYELSSPGIGISGAAGILCLVLAFFGFQTLPVSVSGIILIILGIGFIVFELFLPTYGIVGILGVISFILGSIMLFSDEFLKISYSLMIGMSMFSFLFLTFIIGSAIKIKNKKPVGSREEMQGKTAVVRQSITKDKLGIVFYDGELWSAASDSEVIINTGSEVEIIRIDGIKLVVRAKS
ncbi:nodulation protein NfeD [Candidatus Dependentiae bacterium]|nr:nodulation protein NfeD [Candidatus Dependentiae bacterium]